MMGHGYRRTRTAAAANFAARPGHADARIPARWPNGDDTNDADSSQQLAAITEFYRQATPEPAVLSAARALAVIARSALDEVLDAYLTSWSAGDIKHKLMAARILSAMAEDHLLAVTAMDIAAGWARQGDQERAVTAAIALGGPLGQRHLAEASRLLWPLTLRDEQVSRVARLAFGELFAAETGMSADRSTVARFLVHKVRPLLKPDATAYERRAALAVVNATLTASLPDSPKPPDSPESPIPVVASRLRTSPADLPPVAELWAAALNSVPHRRSAVIALHLTLAALSDDVDSVHLAARLGRAILPRLTVRTREVLELTLPDPQRTEAISPRVIGSFLNSFLNADRETVGAR
jgi:hypothetical protein